MLMSISVDEDCIGTQNDHRNVIEDCMVARALTKAGLVIEGCGFEFFRLAPTGKPVNLPEEVSSAITQWCEWRGGHAQRPTPFTFQIDVPVQ